MLVMGSSVMVYSAFRLVKAAVDAGAKVVAVNVGETRADPFVDSKVRFTIESIVFTLTTMKPLQC